MAPVDVLFALTGDVRRNSRAIRQLGALSELGLSVEVLTFGPPATDAPPAGGVRLRVLNPPRGGGPRFFSRIDRLFRSVAAETPARIYHASDLYVLPALSAAAREHGGRLVYDARELYPYVASTRRRPWSTAYWRLIEGRHIRRADLILTVSDGIARHLAGAYSIEAPLILYNAPPAQHVARSNKLRDLTGAPVGAAILLHQGQIRRGRGCDLLVQAMSEVSDATLVFMGDGSHKPSLMRRVDRLGLQDRVRFLDPVPPAELLAYTASADAGITLLEDTCLNHRLALPNKLFEYLAAGLPVLGSNLPEVRRVVEDYDVGMVVDPADRAGLRHALQRMASDAEARGRWAGNAPAALETFGWDRTFQSFARHYLDLLSPVIAP